ncbi:hypothetical protein L0V05_01105 [Tabrizicola sp. J26]|uniref:hypothetical protein n=1 Tax=Alitabrizicola rongguiensis TaxID=2909234 RepID=UPI001F27FEB1|nr:hypothetical protein [Tabrizicola rongguiensis]MCF1707404.1 hypothetical protein [Tabrizicola rongguiensis]
MPRLVIDIRAGHLEVEGSEEFIRSIFEDFRTNIGGKLGETEDAASELPDDDRAIAPTSNRQRPKRRRSSSTAASNGSEGKKSPLSNPEIDPTLKIDDLKSFFLQRKPTGNPQILLVIIAYLRDTLDMYPATVNQIYTCYWALRSEIKIPAKFRQAIIDTVNKKKWLEWKSQETVAITNIGENALNHEIGK